MYQITNDVQQYIITLSIRYIYTFAYKQKETSEVYFVTLSENIYTYSYHNHTSNEKKYS
jgi:hypothetical protein